MHPPWVLSAAQGAGHREEDAVAQEAHAVARPSCQAGEIVDVEELAEVDLVAKLACVLSDFSSSVSDCVSLRCPSEARFLVEGTAEQDEVRLREVRFSQVSLHCLGISVRKQALDAVFRTDATLLVRGEHLMRRVLMNFVQPDGPSFDNSS